MADKSTPKWRPLLAARLVDAPSAPKAPGVRYDEDRQLSVGLDGRALVEGIVAGLETITEARRDAADPVDPQRGLDTATKTVADSGDKPWLAGTNTFSTMPAPDPSDPPTSFLSPLETLSKTTSPDPADPPSAWLSPVETTTRAGVDTDRLSAGGAASVGSDDMATGVVGF